MSQAADGLGLALVDGFRLRRQRGVADPARAGIAQAHPLLGWRRRVVHAWTVTVECRPGTRIAEDGSEPRERMPVVASGKCLALARRTMARLGRLRQVPPP